MYLLIVFNDLEQQDILFLGYFEKIKDIIAYTGGVVRYTDSVSVCPEAITKHKTLKKLFKIVKL